MPKNELILAVQLIGWALYALLLVRVVFSWLRPRRLHPLLLRLERLAFAVTEPMLRPIRRLLYRFQSGSPIDFSPLVLYLLIELVQRLLIRAIIVL